MGSERVISLQHTQKKARREVRSWIMETVRRPWCVAVMCSSSGIRGEVGRPAGVEIFLYVCGRRTLFLAGWCDDAGYVPAACVVWCRTFGQSVHLSRSSASRQLPQSCRQLQRTRGLRSLSLLPHFAWGCSHKAENAWLTRIRAVIFRPAFLGLPIGLS